MGRFQGPYEVLPREYNQSGIIGYLSAKPPTKLTTQPVFRLLHEQRPELARKTFTEHAEFYVSFIDRITLLFCVKRPAATEPLRH